MTPDAQVVLALRLGAIALASYLTLVFVVGVVVRVAGLHPLAAALDAITPRLVRRMVTAVVGFGLTLPALAATAEEGSDPPVVLHRLPDATTSTTTTTPFPAASDAIEPTSPSPESVPSTQIARPDTDSGAPTMWTVEPGQHFWSIAESVLATAWGRPPTDRELAPYWRALVEANRDRLVHVNNADLIFPAQTFVVPAPPRP